MQAEKWFTEGMETLKHKVKCISDFNKTTNDDLTDVMLGIKQKYAEARPSLDVRQKSLEKLLQNDS